MTVAVGTAKLLGFTIAPPCQGHLRNSLQQANLAAMPIAKGEPPIPFPSDLATRLLLARARVAQFTAAMAVDALRNGPPADMMLHENNFFGVMQWICPLWPVC